MDFGLFYELETLEDRGPMRDYRLLHESTDEVIRAEQAGFTHVWAVEHHFREHFSHAAAPEVWLAALSQRTERIRLGHGVVQTIPSFNHPVRVAERAATLDNLSNGRLDLGTGRAVNIHELGGWNITGNTRDMWRESVELISQIFQAGYEPINYDGEWVSIHDRVVLPRPFQDPHPPLWVACTSPESYRIAGEMGLGVLGFGMAVNAEAMGRRIVEYHQAMETGRPVGAFKNDQVAIMLMAFCAETREEAFRVARDPFNWYLAETLKAFLGWAGEGTELPKGYEWYIDLAKHRSADAAATRNFDYLYEGGMILCGTPDDLIETIETFEAVGMTQMLMAKSIGGIPHEDVLRSIDLIGREVIPHFEQKAAAKQQSPEDRREASPV
jgi:alkanesulfonate monooxygenase SsuD/methylene tetrahydromethanopterin reductase-like flavin-dependent oxidoreductase (luciferase family)